MSTVQDSVNKRLEKAEKFLNNSHSMLRNDLIYYSALTDAISAIKSYLEGYIYSLITQHQEGAPQSLLDAVKEGKLPKLLQICRAEHLPIPDKLEQKLLHLNVVRNVRTHQSPDRQVYHTTAQDAIKAADDVRMIVRVALGLEHAPARGVPASPVAASAPAATAAPAMPAVSAEANALANDEPDDGDEDVSPRAPSRGSRLRRLGRALGRIAAVLLLLLVGIAAGVGIMIPVASGNTPSWLSFATRLLPTPASSSVATQTPSPTATAAATGPIILGAVTVSAPVCGSGVASLQLHNTGLTTVQWAVGSPGASTPMFARTASETPRMTLFGSLPSASAVTIYVSGTMPVVLTTDGGSVQLTIPAC